MNPFFFGTGKRRLFGLYTPGRVGGRAVVLCYPWGQEYLRAHRSIRHLAGLLTRAGVHVLRFDYFGTGDSAGEMTDGDLAGWQSDIETAMEELKDMTGAAQVGLVGLRLGGTLAAEVASRRREDVDALVLWDPVIDGEDYLRELRKLSLLFPSPPRAAASGGGIEVLGFPLTDSLARELPSLRLPALAPALPKRTLVVVSEARPEHDGLRTSLQARPTAPVPFEQIISKPAWLEDQSTGVGAIPVKVVQRTVEWFGSV